MTLPFLRTIVMLACMAAASCACAQSGDRSTDPSPDAKGDKNISLTKGSAFAVRIQAPADIGDLLTRHMELQRYRDLADLSDSEIQSLLQAAQEDASDLLATLGYFSPEIKIVLQRAEGDKGRVVQITVLSGPQTRVDSIRLQFEGAVAKDPTAAEQRKSIEDLWSLARGEPFTQDAWDNAKAQALKQLLAKRYATATLVDSKAEVHPEQAGVDLSLQLDSGPAYKIGQLDIEGNQRYSVDLARRLARLPMGEDYALSHLVEAQQRLTDSGYYDSAYLSLDTTGDPEAATVKAQLKEASMQKVVYGIGASTDTGARVSLEHTYNQVPGIDWRAVNKITLARDTKSFASDWTSQPDESRWRWAASALLNQDKISEIEVYTQRYRFGRLTTDAVLDQNYYLQYEGTEAVQREINQSSTSEAVSANYAFGWKHFDSTPFPNSGWGLGGELSVGTVIGSNQEPFSRALFHGRVYQPLGQSESNFFVRQHAGRIQYRGELGAVVVNNATSLPFTQLFLTGGDTSVRGYKRDEIGITENGVLSADAGRYVAVASVEWQRPLVIDGQMTDWETAVFVDTGAVANQVEEFSFKTGVGVGARWRTPIGPLQIDVAYGIATQSLRLHLNVGFTF